MEKALTDLAADPAIRKVGLYVTRPQTAAIQLYQSLGFEHVGAFKDEMLVGDTYIDSLAMEKKLK